LKALKEAAALRAVTSKALGALVPVANITWLQEAGASAIEVSKIAGHGAVSMPNDYTHVQLKRQEEQTRAIQGRLEEVQKWMKGGNCPQTCIGRELARLASFHIPIPSTSSAVIIP